MRYKSDLEKLQINADRCRELAHQASDPEVAEALHHLAGEMESARQIIDEERERRTGTNG
jgi:hypothetical protein